MTALEKIFLDLTALLQRAVKSRVNLFNDGINQTMVEECTFQLELNLPQEVYALYQWANGTKGIDNRPTGESELFPMGIFFPIEYAVKEYKQNVGNDTYWPIGLFPLFGSGDLEYFLIDCREDCATKGAIYYYSPLAGAFDRLIRVYDSLESLLLTTVECYQKNVYYFEDYAPAMLEADFELRREIASRLNPHSHFWKVSY